MYGAENWEHRDNNVTIDSTGQLKTKVGVNFNHEAGDPTDRMQVVQVKASAGGVTLVKDVIVEVTDVDEPPNKPTAVAVSGTGENSIIANWRGPTWQENRKRPRVTGFAVQYREDGETDWTAQPHRGTGPSVTINGLEPQRTYEVRAATINDEGQSAWSDPGSGDTANPPPTTNEQVQLSNIGQANHPSGRPVSAAGKTMQAFTTGTNATGYELDSVSIHTLSRRAYSMSLCETDARGRPTAPCTSMLAPSRYHTDRPTKFWAPPAAVLTANNIYAIVVAGTNNVSFQTTGTGQVDATSQSGWDVYKGHGFWHEGYARWFVDGRTKAFKIAVHGTARGASATVPKPPQNFQATGGDAKVTLSWNAPSDDGGSPITGYEYRYGGGNPAPTFLLWRSAGSSKSAVETEVANGQIYTFELRAKNTVGDSTHVTAVVTPSATATFTGRISNGPTKHDGTTRFSFDLDFSAAPTLTAGEDETSADVLKRAFTSDGVDIVTVEQREEGNNAKWRVTAAPQRTGPVTIKIEKKTCTDANAICAGTTQLANDVTTTIRGTNFEGVFTSLNKQHNAAPRVSVNFELNDLPASALTEQHMRHNVFDVESGTLDYVYKQRNGRIWALWINPTGVGDIKITTRHTTKCDEGPRMCSADGRILAGTPEFVMPGPALITVSNASVREAPGAKLTFTVKRSRESTRNTRLNYRTSGGTATPGRDYNEQEGTVWLYAGQREVQIEIDVHDDQESEGSETITLTIENPPDVPSGQQAHIRDGEGTGTITNNEAASALTASFARMPASHDGVNPFTFDVHLTPEPVGLSYKLMAKVFDITGGRVTKARRIEQGRNQRWRIRVDPSHRGNVGINLPAKECTERNALCADGRRLVAGIATTVKGSEFKAWFSGVPEEHRGKGTFNIYLEMNETPAELTATHVRDNLFDIQGASLEVTYRMSGGRKWLLRLRPSGNEDVSVTLRETTSCTSGPAVCTSGGQKLAGTPSATIVGPAIVTIEDTEVQEGPNAKLVFKVKLSKPRTGTTRVLYSTADGTATAGEDYTASEGQVVIRGGRTERTFEISVLDDAIDEGDETMTVTIVNPPTLPQSYHQTIGDDTATGTIKNSDPMPKAWSVRFGRAIGTQLVGALENRLAGEHGSYVTVGGISLVGEVPTEEVQEEETTLKLPEWTDRAKLDSQTMTMTTDEMIMGSSFFLSNADRGGRGPVVSGWGRFTTSGFEAEEDNVTLNGTVTTGLFGADAKGDKLLAGVMVAQSSGDGAYLLDTDIGDDRGNVESTMLGIYPYGSYDLNKRVSLWGLTGFGSGELTLHRKDAADLETDIEMRMGAFGVKGQVLDGSGPTGIGLNIRSDAMWVQTETDRIVGMMSTKGDTSRVRLIVEANREIQIGEGKRLTPTGEVGLRIDGGDAETGTGLEVGAGIRYAAGPLTIQGQVRALVAHEESGYEEWGASGAIRVSPSASGRGLTFSLAPVWGNAGSASERLWSARTPGELESGNEFEATGRIETEVGYGMSIPRTRGVVTPYTGLSLAQGASRKVRVGARWNLAPGAVLGLEGSREEGAGGNAPAKSITFRTELRW